MQPIPTCYGNYLSLQGPEYRFWRQKVVIFVFFTGPHILLVNCPGGSESTVENANAHRRQAVLGKKKIESTTGRKKKEIKQTMNKRLSYIDLTSI